MHAYRIINFKKKRYNLKTPITEFTYNGYKLYESNAVYDYENGNISEGVTVYLKSDEDFIDCERSNEHKSAIDLLNDRMNASKFKTFTEVLEKFSNIYKTKMPVKQQQFELHIAGVKFSEFNNFQDAFNTGLLIDPNDFSVVQV